MRLVYKATQQPVNVGDTVELSGEPRIITLTPKPRTSDSEGHVFVTAPGPAGMVSNQKLDVSVIGAEWIEREDVTAGPDEDPPPDFDPEFPNAPDDDEADAHKCERDREGRAA